MSISLKIPNLKLLGCRHPYFAVVLGTKSPLSLTSAKTCQQHRVHRLNIVASPGNLTRMMNHTHPLMLTLKVLMRTISIMINKLELLSLHASPA